MTTIYELEENNKKLKEQLLKRDNQIEQLFNELDLAGGCMIKFINIMQTRKAKIEELEKQLKEDKHD